MESSDLHKKLQRILDNTVDNKKIFGASFALKKDDLIWHGASGNIGIDQPFFIASTTKLFTTAIILKLRALGKLNLNDKIHKYISMSNLAGLHTYKGTDYSNDITVKHLLSHTSGLPDYFQDKGTNKKSLEHELMSGLDQFWTFSDVIEKSKSLQSLFVPGAKAKAHYSDTNFQLLGRIIEVITGRSYSVNCHTQIIKPLSLTKTYLYEDPTDKTPATIFYKKNGLSIPKAMASFGPDGGIVSTSRDMLTFIEAFFTGQLFPESDIQDLQEWNKIFFPLQSGVGIHLFKLPWIFNPTGSVPYFLGHSGLSGALAYYSPKDSIYIAGTVNQLANPDISFKTMIQLCSAAKIRK